MAPGLVEKQSTKEKDVELSGNSVSVGVMSEENSNAAPIGKLEKLQYWAKKLDSYGLESRGIERVKPEDRSRQNWLALCLIWASAGINLASYSTGYAGVAYFNLSLPQALGIIWGVGALGSAASAYMAIFGKRNGLRALVSSRFAFGWYGAMVMAFLNGFSEVSYGILDAILGGQALRTVSKDTLPLSAGIFIISAVSWIIATGGYKFIHWYSRIAFVFPLISFLAMFAVFGPKFDSAPIAEPDNSATHAGYVLSYIAIIFGSCAGWVPVSADYYIYFPENTADWKIFLMSFLGIWVLPSLSTSCGAGFASVTLHDPEWAALYNGSDPSFIGSVLSSLGNARFFFMFLLAWSLISNNVFNLYSISISAQLLGNWAFKIPRFIWTFWASAIITVLSIVGRNSFSSVLVNLLALIGYWSMIYFAIFSMEYALIRRKFGLDLDAWNDRTQLPPGYAAGLAFCFGIMGAVLGMNQTWYKGKIAILVGSAGGDLGIELGMLFSALVYPIFRYLEFKKFWR